MYCSQCGKRVKETMRFCPFCGSEIEIPDQGEIQEVGKAVQREVPKTFSEQLQKDDSGVFIPLSMDESVWKVPDAKPEPQKRVELEEKDRPEPLRPSVKEREKEPAVQERPPRRTPSDDRPTQTYTPQRRFDPDDIFFDAHDDEDEDEEIRFEEEDGGFLARHTRGLVALIMVLVLVVACACYLYTDSGQRLLTRFDLAWKPQAYSAVAYQDYAQGRYDRAAAEYARALSLAPDNYEYARSAGINYLQAGDKSQAEAMARAAIAIDPDRQDAYTLLERIYPSAQERPADIAALLAGH